MKNIPLSQGKQCLVDDDVYPWLACFRWACSANRYAVRSFRRRGQWKQYKMHRLILAAQPGEIVDHINGNTLDNRRENLRLVTSEQNSWNVAPIRDKAVKYRGVWLQRGKYAARITCKGAKCFVGYFETPELAAVAYDCKAKELYGPYARLNFPDCTDASPAPRKRNIKLLTGFGETKTVSEWAKDPRCKPSAPNLRMRLLEGWEPEQAITQPVQAKG